MAKYKNFSDARNLRPKIVDARYNCRNMIFISLEVERPIVKDGIRAKCCETPLGQSGAAAESGIASVRVHDEYPDVRIGIRIGLAQDCEVCTGKIRL